MLLAVRCRVGMTISGTGTLAETAQGAQANPEGGDTTQGGGMSARQGPGGGLGKPIDSPDPLSRYRWPLLGGLAALLVAGGVYVAIRKEPAGTKSGAALAENDEFAPEKTITKTVLPARSAPATDRSGLLLDAMKEELFQLEVDRQQGRISETEYAEAKAALDTTLKRAIGRAVKN